MLSDPEPEAAPCKKEIDAAYYTAPNGLRFAINRVKKTGHLCGYVQVPLGHPVHGKNYNAVHEALDVRVHGGLTYSEKEDPITGEPDADGGWWLGFDAAHSGDLIPAHGRIHKNTKPGEWAHEIYRTVEYMVNQCLQLTKTLDAMACAERLKGDVIVTQHSERGGFTKYGLGNIALSLYHDGAICICVGNNCRTFSPEESKIVQVLFEEMMPSKGDT